jgi:hypothetical protein
MQQAIDSKTLCLRLLKAESEDEVTSILQETGYLNDTSAWSPLGGSEGNLSIVNNQQAHPVASLVEKLVNSIDAVLIDECERKGITPSSHDAPKSMNEASEKLFNVPKGLLQNLSAAERTKLAERISLIATGASDQPCYTIVDSGEGQSPARFPTTLCSLPTRGPSYKSRIRFVQGIYNMGGSGVLPFCGTKHYQLIISKRDPKLLRDQADDSIDSWGFTLVRREFPVGEGRYSTYKYLAPNGRVLSFNADELPIMPGAYPIAHEQPLRWGTCIKLFNYNLQPKALASAAILDLYFELSLQLFSMALPLRVYERRQFFTSHTYERTLSGMSVRIEQLQNVVEDNYPAGGKLVIPTLGELNVWICAFKREVTRKSERRKHWFGAADKAILFVVNGQAHGYLQSSFFRRDRINLNYLAKDLLVVLDCSNIPAEKRENLFMASRERLRDSPEKQTLVAKLEEYIGDHAGLKELNQRRWQEEIQSRIGDDKPLQEILDKLIKASPSLATLFSSGDKLLEPKRFEWLQVKTNYRGKRFPTFFRLEGELEEGLVKSVPHNKSCLVRFETDAENNYFSRQNDPGLINLSDNEIKESVSLWNGCATLRLKPAKMQVGDVVNVNVEVSDSSRSEPLKSMLKLKILEDAPKKKQGEKGITKGPEKEGRRKKYEEGEDQGLQLPRIHEIHETAWSARDPPFDGYTGLELLRSPKGDWDAYVNMDNQFLITEIQASQGEDPKLLKQQFKYGLVLIAVAMLHYHKERSKKLQNQDQNGQANELNGEEQAEMLKRIRDTSCGVSMVILPIIKSLGKVSKSSLD